VFYTLQQQPGERPTLQRQDSCLSCHFSDHSLGVPGMMSRSMFTAPDGRPLLIFGGLSVVDHRTPMEERWGGYYVTGVTGAVRHLGNAVFTDEDENHPQSVVTPTTLKVASLEGKFDTRNYLLPFSDASALMVFNHQMHMQNLITRVGWEFRTGQSEALLRAAVQEFVDYLLFIEEAPLTEAIEDPSLSAFARKFAARGPRDTKGRSLRDLDLYSRLLRYPCSYMIYSLAFDALPAEAKDAIYGRMWEVLSGAAKEKKYGRLSLADRRAIVEILRDTKAGLPAYFHRVR